MFGYIVRRLISAFLVVVVTTMIVFAIFFFGPTNTADYLCQKNGHCTEEKLANLNESLGLNEPVWQQYGVWVKGLFAGREVKAGATYQCDAPCLGISFVTKTQVTTELRSRYPATLSLAIGASVIFLTLGVFTGTVSARRRGTLADKSLVSGTLLLSSIPYIIFAFLAWLFLINQWGWFADSDYTPMTDDPAKWFTGLLLPWLVLGVYNATNYARFSRGSMIDSLSEDYVRTAVAKGVPRRVITLRHALRAAIVPIVTIFGIDFAYLLSGTLVTEYIFGIDGIGRWGLQAIGQYDFPVVAATVLVGAILIVVANLVVDIAYSFLDPRVRLV
jgi:peptide/nickel transport system permease protein